MDEEQLTALGLGGGQGVQAAQAARKKAADGIDLDHLSDLAMLKIPMSEREATRKSLKEIIGFADQLAKIDTDRRGAVGPHCPAEQCDAGGRDQPQCGTGMSCWPVPLPSRTAAFLCRRLWNKEENPKMTGYENHHWHEPSPAERGAGGGRGNLPPGHPGVSGTPLPQRTATWRPT